MPAMPLTMHSSKSPRPYSSRGSGLHINTKALCTKKHIIEPLVPTNRMQTRCAGVLQHKVAPRSAAKGGRAPYTARHTHTQIIHPKSQDAVTAQGKIQAVGHPA
eukprot:1158610-Pelagomonas_calceolata.AAC.2